MISLPQNGKTVLEQLTLRIFVALFVIVFVAFVVWLDRDGYRDAAGNAVTFLDALYYSTVSVTTTGYGDIIPISERARLTTTVIVTPARVIFLIILVGTTIELLFGKFKESLQRSRWQKKISGHYVIVGFGVKGKSAAKRLVAHGEQPSKIVIVDSRDEAISDANEMQMVAVQGEASRREVLRMASVGSAKTCLIALDSDDETILTTLRIKEESPGVPVIATCRDSDNAESIEQAGAESVIVSATAAGRLLALSGEMPHTSAIMQDLLDPEEGVDILETKNIEKDDLVLGIVKAGKLYSWPDSKDVSSKDFERAVVIRPQKK